MQNRNVPLASSASYSRLLRCRSPVVSVAALSKKTAAIVCSISQVYGYGTVDYERRPIVQWNAIYKKISLMEKPELGAASVLNQWEKAGRKLTKWELCRVVKELRKYKRANQALEVRVLLVFALALFCIFNTTYLIAYRFHRCTTG